MIIFDPFLEILGFLVNIYFKIVVVQIAIYWLMHFNILQASNKYAQKTVELLDLATKPVYDKLKSKLPLIYSNFDFSPFVLLLIVYFVARLIASLRILIAG